MCPGLWVHIIFKLSFLLVCYYQTEYEILGTLDGYAPESLEEFQKIKNNNISRWNSLVNSYEDNLGNMDKMKIVELDDFAFNTKKKGLSV